MTTKVTVIGAGPGGYVAAIRASQLGAAVTLIERERVGGTCLNWGCIPSKIMKATADRFHAVKHAAELGIMAPSEATLDMTVLTDRKQKIIDLQAKGIQALLKKNSIRTIEGDAHLMGPGHLTVSRNSGESEDISWDRLIIASGSRPVEIPTMPFDGEGIISSNDVLFLDRIPESLLIVGGGVVGCEFAYIMSALGSRVTVVEAMDRMLPLPSIDPACSKVLQREMKKQKIKMMVNRTVEKVHRHNGVFRATIGPSPFDTGLGKRTVASEAVETTQVLVCVGRCSDAGSLGLDTIGVSLDDKGWVMADDRMETSMPGVYAVGDVLGPSKIMLAHVASAEGIVAAENAMGAARLMNYRAVPGAVFAALEVANVGLTEVQAVESGMDVRCDTVLYRTLGKAQATGEIPGQATIVSDCKTGRVLGVHLAGARATDLIAEGTLAVNTGRTLTELAETIHAHPTFSEIMGEAALKGLDLAVHG
jgi:dihydrolipoamide dehydrogenase